MKPTNELRFVVRNGRKILQQKWIETSIHSGTGTLPKQVEEWIDVPEIVEE